MFTDRLGQIFIGRRNDPGPERDLRCSAETYKSSVFQDPEQFGLERGQKSDIVGGTPEENAEITRGILTGTIRDSRRNIVLMNAGAAIYCGGGAASLEEGVKKAAEVIDNGKAMEVLENYVRLSNEAD